MQVLIFTFRQEDNPNIITSVYRDSNNYATLTWKTFTDPSTVFPTPTVGNPVGVPICIGVDDDPTYTKVTYLFKLDPPFATYVVEYNSPYCGYDPSPCNLRLVSIVTTNETISGGNDGTVKIVGASSYPIVEYTVDLNGVISGNSTGYITGLHPGNYTYLILDTRNCIVRGVFTIYPSTLVLTHYKYRLKFNSILTGIVWECRFLDMRHNYDNSIYPIDLDGTDQPIMHKVDNPDEDKTEPMLLTTVTINLWNNGLFTVDEFALSDERTWKIELYRNGSLYFQGWLLPDQIQDLYADPNYGITLIATDGIASLKGNQFADQTLFTIDPTTGITVYQQLFGIRAWSYLVRCCLKQLNYDYLYITILSSLQNNDTPDLQIWTDIGTWGDILYDINGVPLDTYSALALLLRAFNFFITQVGGTFVIGTWNDLYYINNPIVSAKYSASFYAFDSDFNQLYAKDYAKFPSIQPVGRGTISQPINPPQSINYDNAYQIEEEDIQYNINALLYDNPSFEFDAVQNELPSDLSIAGTVNAYSNYDPQTLTSGAYNGSWEMRIIGFSTFYEFPADVKYTIFGFYFEDDNDRAVYNTSGYVIDQPGLCCALSFVWRPVYFGTTRNSAPTIFFRFFPNEGGEYFYSPSGVWISVDDPVMRHAYSFIPVNVYTTDFVKWQSYSLQTVAFPGSGIGQLYVGFRAPIAVNSDGSIYFALQSNMAIDIDSWNITTPTYASSAYNNQTGETNTVTNLTSFAKSEQKSIDQSLFTYEQNKRAAGNVFTFHDYTLGAIVNTWRNTLNNTITADRLQAIIIQAIARNYQRPMRIFEGDVKTDDVQFWGVFSLAGYTGVLFMPFSVESDLRNSVSHIVIVELDDSAGNSQYTYLQTFEANARGGA